MKHAVELEQPCFGDGNDELKKAMALIIIMQNNISARAAHFCTFLSVFARLARETQRDVYEKRKQTATSFSFCFWTNDSGI